MLLLLNGRLSQFVNFNFEAKFPPPGVGMNQTKTRSNISYVGHQKTIESLQDVRVKNSFVQCSSVQ